MNRMTLDLVSISSDDEDVPLTVVGASLHAHPASVSLKTHSLENCEFCEQVSHNKYDALIHNAKHIIIPLLKQELHQCPLCLFHFTSRYKLKHHLRNKHKNDNVNKEQPATTNKITVKNDIEKSCVREKNVSNEIVNNHETDEDDLPLKVTLNLKDRLNNIATEETEKCAVSDDDALIEARDKLLKDVKVVLEKLETDVTNNIKILPEKEPRVSNHNVKVSIQPNATSNHNIKVIHNIEHNVTSANNVKVNNIEPKVKLNNHSVHFASNVEPSKSSTHNSIPDRPRAKISSRLAFEEDIDDLCNDEVIKDLTRDCLVDMKLFDEPWIDDLANSITDDDLVNLDDDIILIDDDDPQTDGQSAVTKSINVQEMEVENAPSTHHDELIKPGVYRCKRCPEMFSTKFNQIQHEMQHIHIRKPRPMLCEHCDRFFATKQLLKNHLTSKHSAHYHLRPFKSCKKCGLKYSDYDRHLEIYHVLLRCHLCNEGFETEVDRLNHIRQHLIKTKCIQCDFIASGIEIIEHQKLFHKVSVSTTKSFNLCDVCCLFLRNKNNMQYVFGESVSKVGERVHCEHCGKMFFHLTQVTRFGKGRPTNDSVYEKKKKVRSNTDRLKNIQQRLKMINKFSRL